MIVDPMNLISVVVQPNSAHIEPNSRGDVDAHEVVADEAARCGAHEGSSAKGGGVTGSGGTESQTV